MVDRSTCALEFLLNSNSNLGKGERSLEISALQIKLRNIIPLARNSSEEYHRLDGVWQFKSICCQSSEKGCHPLNLRNWIIPESLMPKTCLKSEYVAEY